MRRAVRRALRRGPRPQPRSEPVVRVEHPICDDLGAWAGSWPGAQRWVLEPAFETTRPLPRTIEPALHPGFAALSSFPVPERAVVRIPGARLRGDVGLVVLPSGEFVGELAALTPEGRRTRLAAEPAYYEPLGDPTEVRAGSHCAVLGFGAGHYYHWSHDLIAGMRGIADLLPPDATLIVPPRLRPFQTETLALLGLEGRPLVPFPKGACWELEDLYVVTPRLKTQMDSSEPNRWFREAAMARYGIEEVAPSRRLYLSRQGDGHWRTTNEAEVEAVLARHGFETVTPAELGFRAQIQVFGRAELIVGTGAGLFNMVFSPPGTKVIQFQEADHMVHALWTVAAAMGFDYHYFLCDPVPSRTSPIADLHVPIDKLEATLEAATA